jgi:hypothetical protein
MDTQKSVEDLEAAGVDSRAARAQVKVLKEALEDYPSVDRLENIFAELRLDLHKELSTFREGMTKDFHGFKFQVTWLLVASLVGIVVNLGLTFWKH